MALPGIDVAMEIDLINQGHAQRVGDSRYEINGRIYLVKPNGATFPVSGDGIISVSRYAMALLRDMIANRHDPEVVETLIERNDRYTDDVVREAQPLFELWKGEH